MILKSYIQMKREDWKKKQQSLKEEANYEYFLLSKLGIWNYGYLLLSEFEIP